MLRKKNIALSILFYFSEDPAERNNLLKGTATDVSHLKLALYASNLIYTHVIPIWNCLAKKPRWFLTLSHINFVLHSSSMMALVENEVRKGGNIVQYKYEGNSHKFPSFEHFFL